MLHRYSKIVIWGCNHSVFSLLTKVGIKDPFHLVSMGCFREDFTQSMWQKGCLIMAQHPHKQPSGWYIVQTDCKRWNEDRGYYNTFSNLHVCPKQQGSLRSIRHTINILYATTNNVQVRTRTLCKWVGKCDGESNGFKLVPSATRASHYLSRLIRGSGGRAFSTGYRSLTAIFTSSTSAVRNRSRFRMVYSWSAKIMLPYKVLVNQVIFQWRVLKLAHHDIVLHV